MSDDRAYRVLVRFEKEGERYAASVPELGLSAHGATRAEAIAKVEEAIDGRMQSAAAGEALPPPVDVLPAPEAVILKLSAAAYRDLAYAAGQDGMSVDALAAELVVRGLGARDGARRDRERERRNAPPPQAPRSADAQPDPDAQPTHVDRPREDRGGRGERRREGYRPEIESQANFLDYVRNLERGGGGNQGGGRGRGRR